MPKYQTRKVGKKEFERLQSGRGFDVVHAINTITPKGVEFHLTDQGDDGIVRKSSFTGPNTNLSKRIAGLDKQTGSYNIITPPINRLDSAAMAHDVAYSIHKDLHNRHIADKKLIKVAEEIYKSNSSTNIQKRSARIVWAILKAKVFMGLGGCGSITGSGNSITGSGYNTNDLIAQAQRQAFDPSFSPYNNTSAWAPLLGLVLTIGVPALVKLLKKKDE